MSMTHSIKSAKCGSDNTQISVETGSDSDSLDSNQIPVLTGFGIDLNLIFKDPPKIPLKIFHV